MPAGLAAGPAVEDHGRAVTANTQAAAFYRQAQQAGDAAETIKALRHTLTNDPGFGPAIADLDALTETPLGVIGGRPMNWERHHIEVVRTAAAGNSVEPPTCSVSTSPVLAATRSRCASSPTPMARRTPGRAR